MRQRQASSLMSIFLTLLAIVCLVGACEALAQSGQPDGKPAPLTAKSLYKGQTPSSGPKVSSGGNPPKTTSKNTIDAIGSFLAKKPIPKKQFTKGGWGGNGGGGLACYPALGAIPTEQEFTEQDVANAAYITMIEFFEFENTQWIMPHETETASQYLERVLSERVEPVHPLLAQKLRHLLSLVRPQKWRPVKSLPLIDDTGDLVLHPDEDVKCVRVQIARRFEISQGEDWPIVELEVAQEAVRKMRGALSKRASILNEAILLAHEAIYILGVKFGHPTSAQSRKMVATLLDENTYRSSLGQDTYFKAIEAEQKLFEAGFNLYAEHFTSSVEYETDRQNELAVALPRFYRIVNGIGQGKKVDWSHIFGSNPSDEMAKMSERLWENVAAEAGPAEAFVAAAGQQSLSLGQPLPEYYVVQRNDRKFALACARVDSKILDLKIEKLGWSNGTMAEISSAMKIPARVSEAARKSLPDRQRVYEQAQRFCEAHMTPELRLLKKTR